MDAPPDRCMGPAPARRARRLLAGVVALAMTLGASPAPALIINVDAPGLAGTPALAAFQRAAGAWEALFSDSVQVNIAASLLPLASAAVLGQTSSVVLAGNYDRVRDAMVADGLAESDDAVLAYLPTAAEFSATVLGFGPNRFFGLSGNLSATKANFKALGFGAAGLDNAFGFADASITFNANFVFDFDRSDGVAPGATDFETVAAHEIGHVLGFDSVVDTVDALIAAGTVTDLSPRTLDLFRFAAGSPPATPAEFTSAARLLVPGLPDSSTSADRFPAVFSDLDVLYPFSTGAFFGDGFQASHWKDDDLGNQLVGIMDPSLAPGEVFHISAADIRALDLIGWDYDPAVTEPASALLLALGLLSLCLSSVLCRSGLARSCKGKLRRRALTQAFSTRSRRRPWTACSSPECVRAPTS